MDEIALPEIDERVVDAMCDMLVTDHGMSKPPIQAARLLAFCVELYRLRMPFPPRRVAAEVIGGAKSRWTIDAVISTRVSQGYLQEVHETLAGNVARRDSTKRRRFYIPDRRVLDIAAAAKRRKHP